MRSKDRCVALKPYSGRRGLVRGTSIEIWCHIVWSSDSFPREKACFTPSMNSFRDSRPRADAPGDRVLAMVMRVWSITLRPVSNALSRPRVTVEIELRCPTWLLDASLRESVLDDAAMDRGRHLRHNFLEHCSRGTVGLWGDILGALGRPHVQLRLRSLTLYMYIKYAYVPRKPYIYNPCGCACQSQGTWR